jgi:hypothetical protein
MDGGQESIYDQGQRHVCQLGGTLAGQGSSGIKYYSDLPTTIFSGLKSHRVYLEKHKESFIYLRNRKPERAHIYPKGCFLWIDSKSFSSKKLDS